MNGQKLLTCWQYCLTSGATQLNIDYMPTVNINYILPWPVSSLIRKKNTPMRKILTIFAIFTSFAASSQSIGINADGSIPNPSAMLDVKSTTKGFLPPRLSSIQRNDITNPAEGLVIYNSTSHCLEVYRGVGWFNLCDK